MEDDQLSTIPRNSIGEDPYLVFHVFHDYKC